jgi:DNA repair and recombination protein RAD52
MTSKASDQIIHGYEASISNQSICTERLISSSPTMHRTFDPNMHSTQQQAFGFGDSSPSSDGMGESTYDRVSRLQAKLNQKLGPEFVSQRAGPSGSKLTYVEGWKIINIANEVFGFEGWSSNLVSLTTDYLDYNEETQRYNVGVSVVMRVTLKEGMFHEDVGYGMIENAKSKGMALDKVRNASVDRFSANQLSTAVQKRSGNRWAEAHPSNFRKRHGQLSIR